MSEHIKVKTGIYKGHRLESGIMEFLGIPYCKTPERWKKAEPLEASNDVFEAGSYSPVCWQHVFDEEWHSKPEMAEECLALNIWAADSKKKRRPVMVWIHGGSYYTGAAHIDCCNGVYCGDKFVEACPDIIYVNFNYRLNVFGMLDLSSLDTNDEYVDSLNLATLDQIEALRWVYENIEAFGGDCENITVFGQSAGGGSVSTLCCLPEAGRYFKKAIIQSAGLSDITVRHKADAAKVGKAIIEKLKADKIEDLLELTPQKLTEAAEWYFEYAGGDNVAPFDTTWGVGIMPENPLEGVRRGIAEHLTIMSGSTSGEYSGWVAQLSEEDILEMAKEASAGRLSKDMIAAFIGNDTKRSRRDALIDLHMDVLLRGIQICMLEALVNGGSKAYNYYISCIPEGAAYKPQHCFEIPYISGKPMNYIYLDVTSGEPCQGMNPEMKLVGQLQGCWANFARYGDPNGEHIDAEWKPYTLQDLETLIIDKQLRLVNGVRKEDMDIVRTLHYNK